MDSIVTPEHLYAFFYGFDKCTTIKRKIFRFLSSHIPDFLSLFLRLASRLLSSLVLPKIKKRFALTATSIPGHSLLSQHPTYFAIAFIDLIMRLVFISTVIPFTIFRTQQWYRFPGNCCVRYPTTVMLSFQNKHPIRLGLLSPTFVSHNRPSGEENWRQKKNRDAKLNQREKQKTRKQKTHLKTLKTKNYCQCVDIAWSVKMLLWKY